jgi:hypothetical protein
MDHRDKCDNSTTIAVFAHGWEKSNRRNAPRLAPLYS